jgi:hypothetical protein
VAPVLGDVPVAVPAVELGGVVDPVVEPPGVWLAPVTDVPLEVGVWVGVVEDPPIVVEVLPSEGALGLTPPPLSAVEVPPVGRSLTLTGAVVVMEVEFGAVAPDLVDAVAESPLAAAAAAGGRTTSGVSGTLGAGSLDAELIASVWITAARCAGATLTTRVWW